MEEEVRPVDGVAQLKGLARRIRALREERGLTQEDFAQACGISVSFASLLERGERSPSYETLLQVAGALGLPLAELLREEGAGAGEAYRLVDFARTRGLTRAQVDQLLAVARALFPERSAGETAPGGEGRPQAAACSQPGCTRPVLARGLCVVHYHRARRARGAAPSGRGGRR